MQERGRPCARFAARRVVLSGAMSHRIPPNSICLPRFARGARRLFFVLTTMAVAGAMVTQVGCAGASFFPSPTPSVSAAPPIPSLDSIPSWALASTKQNEGDVIVGIGSGESLDQATRYALSDVASRLSVSIESQLRDVYREIDGTSTASLEHVIQTRVLGTQFRGWERSRSVTIRDVFWVEVQIDRARLVRDSLVELHEVASSIDLQLDRAQGSALSRLIVLEATASDRDRVANLVALVDGLRPTFNRDEWNRRQDRWRSIDDAARRALVFEVRSDTASQEVARWLESQLAAEQLATRSGSCTESNHICIDIRSEVVEADVASRSVTRIRSFFSILEPGGNLIREVGLSGRGNSNAGPDRAKHLAMDDLRRNFESARILDRLIEP